MVQCLSHVRLFATPWTEARQASLSMGFTRQEYWSGLPFPFPGDLLDPGIEPRSPALQLGALLLEPSGKPVLNYRVVDIFVRVFLYMFLVSFKEDLWLNDMHFFEPLYTYYKITF